MSWPFQNTIGAGAKVQSASRWPKNAKGIGQGRIGAVLGQGGAVDYGLLAFAQDARAQAFYNSTSPASFYIAARNETWCAYEGWDSTKAVVRVRVSYHSQAAYLGDPKAWGPIYTIAATGLQGDSHGVPGLEYTGGNTTTGLVIVAYGNHNSGTRLASCLASDPSTWTTETSMTSANDTVPGPGTGSYPRLTMVVPNTATGMYLMYRQQYDTGNSSTSSDRLMLRKSSNLTQGSVAFGTSEQTMIYLDGDSRVYGGNLVFDNGIIWQAITRANYGDSIRQDVFVVGVDTNNSDRLVNWAGDFTLDAASWPLDRTTANAHFRVVTQGSGLGGNTPSLVKLSDGSWVLQFSEGDGVAGSTPVSLYGMKSAGVGQAWGAPTLIASMPTTDPRFEVPSVAPYGNNTGQCQFVYPVASGIPYDPTAAAPGGGDAYRRIMDADGTLHAPELIITQAQAANGEPTSWPLNRFTVVRDGPADCRLIFCQDNGDQTHNTGTLRTFMLTDSAGLLGTDWGPDLSGWLKRLAAASSGDRPTDAQISRLYAMIKARRMNGWYSTWWDGYWQTADKEAWSLIPFRNAKNTKVKTGTITFTANVGAKGNGTNGKYTYGFNMNAIPDTSIIRPMYCPGGPSNTVGRDIGCASQSAIKLYVTQASGNALCQYSSSAAFQPVCDGTGLIIFVRDHSKHRVFQERVELGTPGGTAVTDVSTTVEPPTEFASGANFGSNQHAIDQWEAYFPAASIANGSLLQADVNTLDAIYRLCM